MKIVVVGGTGLIGSKVVEALIARGHDAIAAARRSEVRLHTNREDPIRMLERRFAPYFAVRSHQRPHFCRIVKARAHRNVPVCGDAPYRPTVLLCKCALELLGFDRPLAYPANLLAALSAEQCIAAQR